jgi:hypothetical protein
MTTLWLAQKDISKHSYLKHVAMIKTLFFLNGFIKVAVSLTLLARLLAK